MKKILAVLAIFLVALSLTACSPKKYALALVTDVGKIDDKSFNQGSWEGLVKYATEKKVTYKYYQPTEDSTAARLVSIDLAVKGGAKVVVTPGWMFAETITAAQTKYPNVKFIVLDANMANAAVNTYSINYAEEQSGYLAGYATVKDGYTTLGYMGGMALPAVERFGIGFVQGADAAAVELGVDVTIKYEYLGSFAPSTEIQTKATGWYKDGIEVIFVAAGGCGLSVVAAADALTNAKMIGVDVDQYYLGTGKNVITSATKQLGDSVYNAIDAFYKGTFQGGKNVTLDASNGGVGLPMANSKFVTFKAADYSAILAKLANKTVVVKNDGYDATGKPTVVTSAHTVVTFVK